MALLMMAAMVPTQADLLVNHEDHFAPGEEFMTDLLAGQHTDAGDIVVWCTNDGANPDDVYVQYTSTDGWVITETHLLIMKTVPPSGTEYFNKNGNPKLGKFPYSDAFSPGETEVTYIYTDGFTWCDPLYIIAHCVVEKTVGGVTQEETGYGEGTEFAKNWAMYFSFTPCNHKKIVIPGGDPEIKGSSPGPSSYWKVTMQGLDDHDWNGGSNVYLGWCLEKNDYWDGSYWTGIELYSSYDPDMPGEFSDLPWGSINWILNNKGTYTQAQIQDAIWYLCGQISLPSNAGTKALITAAQGHEDFYPTLGQNIAIICDLPDTDNSGAHADSQDIFIEVDP